MSEFKHVKVENISPDWYLYLDMFDHTLEAFKISLASDLTLYLGRGFAVENDSDVLRMFES